MRTLVWFRADLRTADNPALFHASADSRGEVVGLFVLCPGQWREHGWGGTRVGFVLRTLGVLAASLKKLGIPLLVERAEMFRDVPGSVLRAAMRSGCGAVYFNDEHELNERRRDEAVEAAAAAEGLPVRRFGDQCLVPPGGVRTKEGKFYTVFSPFRKALYRQLESAERVTPLRPPAKQKDTGVAADAIPAEIDGFGSTVRLGLWPAGEAAAGERLREFVDRRLGEYKVHRDLPASGGSSALSPYLAVGAVSARQCLHAALAANGGRLGDGDNGAVQWISELAWREFYRHILVGFPRVSMGRAFKPETERVRWRDDPAGFGAWCEGRTGVPIVDAGMRQLARDGWMHNRVRMITAMFLTKNLLIDWRLGEAHFMRLLIDGDLGNNNGGWQWSASTGTDAAPYFRVFNPVSQSRRCDPDGAYIREFVPELGELGGGAGGGGDIHDPAAAVRARLGYPEMIVDLAKSRARAIEAFRALKR